jgi:hypothetical protein
MGDEEVLDNDDIQLEDEVTEEGAEDQLHVADYDIRRRLEDQLEERRLRKMIQDFDYDLD